jgi:hypothetical protein
MLAKNKQKKEYQKPRMKVFPLKIQGKLLYDSNPNEMPMIIIGP